MVALVLACVASAADAALAQPSWTIWNHLPHETGNWFDADNWTTGVPTSENLAAVLNESTIQFDGGTAAAESLFILRGDSSVIQSGGSLEIGDRLEISNGKFQMRGGDLNATSLGVGSANFFPVLPDLSDVPLPETDCVVDEAGSCIPVLNLGNFDSRFTLAGGAV
jgi:hypothetical protein